VLRRWRAFRASRAKINVHVERPRRRVAALPRPGCNLLDIAAAPSHHGIVFERADLVIDLPFITAQHWAHGVFAVAQALGVLPPAEAADRLRRQRFSHAGAR
jgi:hypothetical protein